jgi:rRNA maturation endonuclease Nob1
MDAFVLATALDLGEEDVVLVTWDGDLSRAAESSGLGVAGIQPR